MRLWIDDIRPAPEGYIWVKSVNEAKDVIEREINHRKYCYSIMPSLFEKHLFNSIPTFKEDVIDIDHDAGMFVDNGGDYIKLLDWLEEKQYYFPIHIHSQNIVGVENMRRIIKRNGWKEV